MNGDGNPALRDEQILPSRPSCPAVASGPRRTARPVSPQIGEGGRGNGSLERPG